MGYCALPANLRQTATRLGWEGSTVDWGQVCYLEGHRQAGKMGSQEPQILVKQMQSPASVVDYQAKVMFCVSVCFSSSFKC